MQGRAGPNRSLRATDSHRDPAPRVGERSERGSSERNPTAAEVRGAGRESDEDILYEARERFRRVNDWETDFRSRAADDVKFVHGDADNHWQWPDNLYSERAERPSLTINKTRQHCLQIINDAKQNKPMVRINPVSDDASKASADVYEGVCRHIEYVSNAAVAYDTATEHQVHAGIGWWRVVRQYERDDGFEMGLRIQRVRDPMSVYMDPDIQEVDGSDARFAFVVDDVARDEFETKYPEYRDRIPQGAWQGNLIEGGWLDEDHVRVCEYFRIVEYADRLHQLLDGSMMHESEVADGAADDLRMLSQRNREVQRQRIEWFKIVGGVIVDERIEPGKYIPLVRVIGEEAVIEGQLERKGHVRALKDPQRMYNYWSSSAVEYVALQSKSPYVAAAESIEAFQKYWDTANVENYSVLPYNARDDQGQPLPEPRRQDPPSMGQAYIAGMQAAGQELMMASGQYQPTLGQPSPTQETSGKAIALRQRQGDNATYHYIDNLAIAIRFTGRILLDLIPIVYDTQRVLQIMAVDGTVDRVQLNPQQPQALATVPNNQQQAANDNGMTAPSPQQQAAAQVVRIFNPRVGQYEVQADVGPGYATKRQQAFDAFLQIVTTAPQLLNVAGDLLMKAADFPMSEDLAERLQRMVPPAVLGQGPSPQEQQLQQQLQGSQAHVALLAEKLAVAEMKLKAGDAKVDVDAYRATTERMGKLLSMSGTDGAYVDGNEVRALIKAMIIDVAQEGGLAPVMHRALMDEDQQQQIIQGLAPAPPPGMQLPGVGGAGAAINPVRPPTMPQ